MKINRHYYYQKLSENYNLLKDKEWLKKAFKCTLEYHAKWKVDEKNLDIILEDTKYSITDYLNFISMKNTIIAEDLRNLEGIS